MARIIINEVQDAFAVTTANQIILKEKKAGQDLFLQNNHDTAIAYLNTSGKATHALAFTSGGSGGTKSIAVGDTIVGETGGATANVVSITITSGAWATNDAAGTLYVDTLTGVFQAETIKVGTDLNLANVAADVDKTRMKQVKPGGTYQVEDVVNEIYVIGSASHYLVRVIGIKSGGHS